MKAITIRQPYAELIMLGKKPIEVRSWPATHRGPLLIHAGLQVDKEACKRLGLPTGGYSRGALIAQVRLADCRTFLPGDAAAAHVAWRPNLYAWILEDAKPLPVPVPVKGRLSFWDAPANVGFVAGQQGAASPDSASNLKSATCRLLLADGHACGLAEPCPTHPKLEVKE